MKTAGWVFVSVLLLVVCCVCERNSRPEVTSCRSGRHQFYSTDLRRCRPCPKCRRGWGLRAVQEGILTIGNGVPVTCARCERCVRGRSYSNRRDYGSCLPCSNCTALSREVRRRCKPSRNAVCGDCKPGYHDVFKTLLKHFNPLRPCQHCSYADIDTPECLQNKTTIKALPDPNLPAQRDVHPVKQNTKSYRKDDLSMPLVVAAVAAVVGVSAVGMAVWFKRRSRTPESPNSRVVYSDVLSKDVPEIPQSQDEQQLERLTRDCDADDHVTTGGMFPPNSNAQDLRQRGSDVRLNLEQKLLLRTVGSRWPELARLLEVDINQLHLSDQDCEGERIHQMLLHWERRFPDRSYVLDAYKAVVLLGEESLAQSLLDKMTSDESPSRL